MTAPFAFRLPLNSRGAGMQRQQVCNGPGARGSRGTTAADVGVGVAARSWTAAVAVAGEAAADAARTGGLWRMWVSAIMVIASKGGWR